jgi:cell wall assembly regulator SMI1
LQPDVELRSGASEADIESLARGFEGLRLPDELIDLLRVLDGCPRSLFLSGVGTSLSAAEMLTESRQRATTASETELAFSPGWAVISSEGWSYVAVVAESEPRPRSAVIDLSYDNQAYPVVAGSLTALVAASADAWEAGIHPDQTWDGTEAGQRAYRDAYQRCQELLIERSREFPSGDGLTARDCVAGWRLAWPVSWPGRHDLDAMPIYAPEVLEKVLALPGSHRVIEGDITELRDRWAVIRDDGGAEAWLSIPPGLAEGHEVSEGSRLRFSVLNDHPPQRAINVPEDGPAHVLRVTGVFET